MKEIPFIAPPAWLGVLGGGQLGRMFVHAAQARGYKVCVLDPTPNCPAAQAADDHLVANYDDVKALDLFAKKVRAVTTEFENVPARSLATLSAHVPVAPMASAVSVAQDRRSEKSFFVAHGFPVGPHAVVESEPASLANVKYPAILKTATLGYDGKGQRMVDSAYQVYEVWKDFGRVPCVLEERIDLALEISVIVARSARGDTRVFPIQENEHVNGILDLTIVPARIDDNLAARASVLAQSVVEGLQYVGVLCVEMFISESGELLLNEIAPRPHNSGHYTIEACDSSQFDQQVRAMVGAPLGSTRLLTPAVMVNLLGDCWAQGEPNWSAVLAIEGAHLHLYGKSEAKPARKMGHVTCTAPTLEEALARAQSVKDVLCIPH